MLELLLALAFGILLGVICGIMPGLHPNNTIPIIFGLSFLFDPMQAAVVLIAAGVSNSFVNFIPSIFVGAPDAGAELSALPGHRMLLAGRGFEAVRLTVLGGLGAVLLSVALLPAFSVVFPLLYRLARPVLHWLLLVVVFYMVAGEEGLKGKAIALYVIAVSGALGYFLLDVVSVNGALFPLLSGMFGLPMLLLAVKDKVRLPEGMSFEHEKIGKKDLLSSVGVGSIAGVLAGLLPGIGSSQATVLAQEAVGRGSDRKFLIAMGGVAVSDVVYSIIALYILGNARSGIAVAVGNLVSVGLGQVLLFLSVVLAAAGIGACMTLKMSRLAVAFLRRVDYAKLCMLTFAGVLAMTAWFSGPAGVAISLVALSIGLIPNIAGVKRSHCMGCLLVPTIMFFAQLSLG
ncbi:MAG: tripartite tricarboxylate transporter permease [Candidatus Aenigmatarchaeota archaeon]